MKQISFLGDSLARLRDFPDDARSEAGHQLNEVQIGNDPDDWKPIKPSGLACARSGSESNPGLSG